MENQNVELVNETESVKSPDEVLAELQDKVANDYVSKAEAEKWKNLYYKSFQDKANGVVNSPVVKSDPEAEKKQFWDNMNRLGQVRLGKGKSAHEHLGLLLKIRDYNLSQGKDDIFPDQGDEMAEIIRSALDSSAGDEKLLATTIQSKVKFNK